MDPFYEKLILLVVDKVLLAGVGAFIAYMAAKSLERYRRNQTMPIEVSKRQATAFVDVFSGLTECSLYAVRIMMLLREETADEEQVNHAVKAFLEARERLREKSYASRFLLRSEIGDAALGASIEIDRFFKDALERKVPAEEMDLRIARIRDSLLPFASHIPQLHLPD